MRMLTNYVTLYDNYNSIMSISDWDEYKSYSDKFDSMYTFIVHDKTYSDLLEYIHKMLDRIKSIKDTTKRKYLNDRVYTLSTYVDDKKSDNKVNSVILVGQELFEIPLNSSQKGVLVEYNIPSIIYFNQSKFNIDYIVDMFYNFSFRHVFRVKNTDIDHIQMNENKKKILMSTKLSKFDADEYIKKNVTGKCIFHGVSSFLKTLKLANSHVYTNLLTNDEIFNIFEREETLSIHRSLEEVLGYVQNEKKSHLIKFGKDIIDSAHKVKTLYCSSDKIKRVNNFFSKNSLNPEIIMVHSLEKGDIGTTLHDDYGGTVAVMHY